MEDHVSVEAVTRLTVRNGGLIHPGELAGFPRSQAEELVARGVARWPTPPPVDPEKKTVDGPPRDKMTRAEKVVRK